MSDDLRPEGAHTEPAAPPATEAPAPPPAPAEGVSLAADGAPASNRPPRRRGSRGGRNRNRSTASRASRGGSRNDADGGRAARHAHALAARLYLDFGQPRFVEQVGKIADQRGIDVYFLSEHRLSSISLVA